MILSEVHGCSRVIQLIIWIPLDPFRAKTWNNNLEKENKLTRFRNIQKGSGYHRR